MRIAAVSVGMPGHGHNLAFAPNALITVVAALYRELGDSITIRLYDEVLLGHDQIKNELAAFAPDALLVGVPVTGYCPSALDLYEWAHCRNIPVLTGGYHFNIPDNPLGVQQLPGQIARLTAQKRGVVVCYAEGEEAVVGYVRHLLDPAAYFLDTVPNLCFEREGQLVVTPHRSVIVGSQPYPALPLAVYDPTAYWSRLPSSDVHTSGHDHINGVLIGRTVVGAKVVLGCTYREARLLTGQKACKYCTLTSLYRAATGQRFWEITKQMLDYVESISWSGPPGIRCYQIGDDMGSDIALVRDMWETRPPWLHEVPLGHRVYASHVNTPELAQMLYEIGVRWLYIGGDGKAGFTPDWSDHHPLIRTMRNCRAHGLAVSVGFVLGQFGQSWKEISAWQRFAQRLIKEFADILIIVDGWVNVIAPGSPDWEQLCQIDPTFSQTDCPDLEQARAVFWKHCTRLCEDGLSPEVVRRRLYEEALCFENDVSKHPRTPRSFMIRP